MLRFLIGGRRENAAAQAEALAALYDAHGARMYGYALALLGDVAEAEDVVQDVFTRLCASGRLPNEPARYLLRAARNDAFSRLRKRRIRLWRAKQLEHEAALLQLRDSAAVPMDIESIERLLKALPPKQREVVVLKILQEMTFEEIAEVLEVSPNTAASRYRYAIERLRRAMTAEGQEQ